MAKLRFLVVLLACAASVSAQAVSATDQEEKLKAELELTAKRFLDTIEKGRPADLLPLFCKSGVVFDIDADPTPVSEIDKDFRKKDYLYCFFFRYKVLAAD